jgi:hypothetical protein
VPFQPGQNPRDVLAHHCERGPKRYFYTYADVALVTGLALTTVRSSGLDMTDLAAVARFVANRLPLEDTKQ